MIDQSSPLAFVLWLGIAGRRNELVIDQVGRQVCAAEGGREYESHRAGTPESELGRFREGLERLQKRCVLLTSLLSVADYCLA